VITATAGGFSITASHIYATGGNYVAGISVTHVRGRVAHTFTPIQVGVTTLIAVGISVIATANQPMTGSVAVFVDEITTSVAADLKASINWGDGTPAHAGTGGPAGG